MYKNRVKYVCKSSFYLERTHICHVFCNVNPHCSGKKTYLGYFLDNLTLLLSATYRIGPEHQIRYFHPI